MSPEKFNRAAEINKERVELAKQIKILRKVIEDGRFNFTIQVANIGAMDIESGVCVGALYAQLGVCIEREAKLLKEFEEL